MMDFFERLPGRLLEWLLLPAPLAQRFVMGLILVAGLVAGLVVVVLWRRRSQPVPASDAWLDGIEDHVSAKARPLMDAPEVSLFNLLLLAVRDHFLLLPKIPLKRLVQLRVDDDSVRRLLAQTLRNVTVDFVAVHPGTRLPLKALFIRKPERDVMASSSQERLVEAVLHHAGIEVIRLDQEAPYSVERLTNLLGLEEDT